MWLALYKETDIHCIKSFVPSTVMDPYWFSRVFLSPSQWSWGRQVLELPFVHLSFRLYNSVFFHFLSLHVHWIELKNVMKFCLLGGLRVRPLIIWVRGADFREQNFFRKLSVCFFLGGGTSSVPFFLQFFCDLVQFFWTHSVRYFFSCMSLNEFFFNLHHAPQMINGHALREKMKLGYREWQAGLF